MFRRVLPPSLLLGFACFAGCGTENASEFDTPSNTSSGGSSSSSSGPGISSGSNDGGSSGTPAGPGCGNGFVEEGEECDDGNAISGDGCSSSCTVEAGYECAKEGVACSAICGDGVVLGLEDCDDANPDDNDGCSSGCRLEEGFKCETPGQRCVRTVCGDGIVEGTEQCDDGPDDLPYDGCFQCVREPSCTAEGCVGACGDGLLFPNEQCDDGNTRDGDGCSSNCTLEPGFACNNVTEELPAQLVIPVVYRDFKSPYYHSDATTVPADEELNPNGHPDFERFVGVGAYTGLVQPQLGNDGKPVFRQASAAPNPCALTNQADARCSETRQMLTTAENFREWFNDGPRARTVLSSLRLNRQGNTDSYVFDSDQAYSKYRFFPLDPGNPENTGTGWGIETGKVCRDPFGPSIRPILCNSVLPDGSTSDATLHNFLFTTELRFWFTYKASDTPPSLNFTGDDDVWIFINGKLVVDLGGLHSIMSKTYVLNAAELGLQDNHVYEISLFHAERHSNASNFKFTLQGFVRTKTQCETNCGDGYKTPDEACDDGVLAGGYNQCAAGCVWGPRCGDGIRQPEFGEECDDGNFQQDDGCRPDCKLGNRVD